MFLKSPRSPSEGIAADFTLSRPLKVLAVLIPRRWSHLRRLPTTYDLCLCWTAPAHVANICFVLPLRGLGPHPLQQSAGNWLCWHNARNRFRKRAIGVNCTDVGLCLRQGSTHQIPVIGRAKVRAVFARNGREGLPSPVPNGNPSGFQLPLYFAQCLTGKRSSVPSTPAPHRNPINSLTLQQRSLP